MSHGLDLTTENNLAKQSLMETQQKIQNMHQALQEKDLGNQAYKSKNFAKAHMHYNNAIALDPNNIGEYFPTQLMEYNKDYGWTFCRIWFCFW